MIARLTMMMLLVAALLAQTLPAQPAADAPSAPDVRLNSDNLFIRDMARIAGQGSTVLRGMGLVVGLGKGKGDKGIELALARPLAKVYEANGNPMPDLRELIRAENAALVAIEVVVPEQGAQLDDIFDVRISTIHSATSIAGGQLILSPLSGPLPGQGVYAMASGAVYIEDQAVLTQGVIRGGARIIQPIPMPVIEDSFILNLLPNYRSFGTAARVADAINGALSDPAEGRGERVLGTELAKPLDDTRILVRIPPEERVNVPQFIGIVMGTQMTLSLVQQAAEVRVNPRTGSIIFAGNVEISPMAISHRNLIINTLVPAPAPDPRLPQRFRERMVGVDTAGRGRERAKIQDLLVAFRQLDVPVEDRIDIIIQMHKSGRLHARLIVE